MTTQTFASMSGEDFAALMLCRCGALCDAVAVPVAAVSRLAMTGIEDAQPSDSFVCGRFLSPWSCDLAPLVCAPSPRI